MEQASESSEDHSDHHRDRCDVPVLSERKAEEGKQRNGYRDVDYESAIRSHSAFGQIPDAGPVIPVVAPVDRDVKESGSGKRRNDEDDRRDPHAECINLRDMRRDVARGDPEYEADVQHRRIAVNRPSEPVKQNGSHLFSLRSCLGVRKKWGEQQPISTRSSGGFPEDGLHSRDMGFHIMTCSYGAGCVLRYSSRKLFLRNHTADAICERLYVSIRNQHSSDAFL